MLFLRFLIYITSVVFECQGKCDIHNKVARSIHCDSQAENQ